MGYSEEEEEEDDDMGKTWDLLLGRTSRKSYKIKILLGLTISRITIIRNHHHVRCNQARGDVAQHLQLGHTDRALLRVEHVIKEQNTLEAFEMIDGYCHLIIERIVLLENQKECPKELQEATSSLIFAASRCGDLPELQSARYIFASKFGKEFTNAAVELRNNCGVNPKMVQKLSARQPSLEIRQRLTKEIAMEKGIKLVFDDHSSEIPEGDSDFNQRMNQSQPVVKLSSDTAHKPSELDEEEEENLSLGAGQEYRDVVSAAQAAFESAAYAAAAARAAVELSRSESQGKGSGDQCKPNGERGTELYQERRGKGETLAGVRNDERSHPSSESEEEIPAKNYNLLRKERPVEKFTTWLERSSSSSSSDSTEAPLQCKSLDSNGLGSPGPKGKEILFDRSDNEKEDWNLGTKPLPMSSRALSFGGRDGNSIRAHRQYSLASDARLSDKQRVSYLKPPYRRSPVGQNVNDSLHEEIGKMEIGSGH